MSWSEPVHGSDPEGMTRIFLTLWDAGEAQGLAGDELRFWVCRTFGRIAADLLRTGIDAARAFDDDDEPWRA